MVIFVLDLWPVGVIIVNRDFNKVCNTEEQKTGSLHTAEDLRHIYAWGGITGRAEGLDEFDVRNKLGRKIQAIMLQNVLVKTVKYLVENK